MTDGDHPSEKLLVIKKLPDGRLFPYVDGERVLGCVDTTVNSNASQTLVQLVFHAALVRFETVDNPSAEKMN